MGKWLDTPETILYHVKDRIARITLNRPEKNNALNAKMQRELHAALLEADDSTNVAVVVIDAAGRNFCSGYDLTDNYLSQGAEGAGESYRGRKTFDDDCWRIERALDLRSMPWDIHKPIICKVQGHCVAGGTDLALQCDMIIAAEDAKIGFPATRANGSPSSNLWLYHVGPQWAKRLLLSGDSMWGRDAARIGLVMDAVPVDQLEDAVMSLAVRLTHIDTDLLSVQKRAINLGMELMGARTMRRLGAEMDARAHLSDGPSKAAFSSNVKAVGLKDALKLRDKPFGDGMVRLGGPQQSG